MKYLLIILIPLIYGCQNTTAQKIDSSIQEDREFEELLSKVETNNKLSLQVQAQATETQKKIVKETVQNITNLKEEVTTLKIELNEAKAALDSVSSDTGSNFILFPIPKDKKDR
jgi:predicted regulator of amino acid metabolism with ACT domain